MNVNLCGYKYKNLTGHWGTAYLHVIKALLALNHTVNISPYITLNNLPKEVHKGIFTDNAIHIYNHTYEQDLRELGLLRPSSILNIYLKPTGPTTDFFTLDTLGYGAFSSPAYKTDYKIYDSELLKEFYRQQVIPIVYSGKNKWIEKEYQFTELKTELPDSYILILGQMPGDTTVTDFSFGNHWTKLTKIINTLLSQEVPHPIVVKLHPTLKERSQGNLWNLYLLDINSWKQKGVIVLDEFENIHSVLKGARVAILENSTAGIECLMNDVPIISFGAPEYLWATKDLRHSTYLYKYVTDLSWYDKQKSRSWLYWYMTQYACKDLESTIKRLKELLAE